MTTFGWKRKAGQNVVKEISSKFSADSESEDISAKVSWIESFKRKKLCLQANCNLKFEEYKSAGIEHAENQRFREAVAEWNKALTLFPGDYKTLEMKAQALLQLNSPFLAIEAAEKAIKINPQWWVAFQTLGRSQLGIGDIEMAKKSFSKAIHLNPSVKELWEEDLQWTVTLIKRKNEGKDEGKKLTEKAEIIFDDDGYIVENDKSRTDVVQCRY